MATKTPNRKRCSYPNCPNSARETMEPDARYIPFAKPCSIFYTELVIALRQPKPTKNQHNVNGCPQCLKCKQWIHLSRRLDRGLRDLSDINKSTYVCDRHFVSPLGPTADHPNPLPATMTPTEIARIKKGRQAPKERTLPTQPNPTTLTKIDWANHVPSPGFGRVDTMTTLVPTAGTNSFSSLTAATADTPAMEVLGIFPCAIKIEVDIPGYVEKMDASVQSDGPELQDACTQSTFFKLVSNFCGQTDPFENLRNFADNFVCSGWACEVQETEGIFLRTSRWKTGNRVIDMEVNVTASVPLACKVFVLNTEQSTETELGLAATKVSSLPELGEFLGKLRRVNVCQGMGEPRYVTAFQDIRNPDKGKMCAVTSVVRAASCGLASRGVRCVACTNYKKTLCVYMRQTEKHPKDSKFCNDRFMSAAQLRQKMKNFCKKMRAYAVENKRLRKKVQHLIVRNELQV